MKQTALTSPPNPAKEKTTWGDVCRQVGFSDNLYRTCRDKLGNEFSPHSPFGDLGSAYDMDFEDVDIDKQLRGQALAIPPPPDDDEELGEANFFEQLMDGSLTNKIMVYGGGALVLWYLYDKFLKDKPASASPKPVLSALPSPARSIPAGQVSDTAPTTVDIPASLRS